MLSAIQLIVFCIALTGVLKRKCHSLSMLRHSQVRTSSPEAYIIVS